MYEVTIHPKYLSILETTIHQITLLNVSRRLYWVDAKQKTISSCDIDGGDVTVERDLSDKTTGFGLVVIGNNAIISTWFKARILSTFVATRTALWTEELALPDSRELFSLVSTATSLQPPSESCDLLWNLCPRRLTFTWWRCCSLWFLAQTNRACPLLFFKNSVLVSMSVFMALLTVLH